MSKDKECLKLWKFQRLFDIWLQFCRVNLNFGSNLGENRRCFVEKLFLRY